MKLRHDFEKDGAAQATVSLARNHVGDEDQDSGGSVNITGDFRRRSLPCADENYAEPACLAPSRRHTRRRSLAWPAPEKETGNPRVNRQGPAGLTPSRRRTAAARSLGPPEVLAGRGGGREIGAEARKTGQRRGGRGGGGAVEALECGQVRAGRVATRPVRTLI
jgi:hypothetical protein